MTTINESLERIESQLVQLDELEKRAKGHPDMLFEIAKSRAKVLATLDKIEALLTRLSGDNLDGSLN